MQSLPPILSADDAMDAPVARMSAKMGARGAAHAVLICAPPWNASEKEKLSNTLEDNQLAWAVTQALNKAEAEGAESLALEIDFGNFPQERAAQIVFGHAHGHLLRSEFPLRVEFVFAQQVELGLFQRVAQNRKQWMGYIGKR